MKLVELSEGDIAAMLAGRGEVRPVMAQPPGGVDDVAVLGHVGRMAARMRAAGEGGGQYMMVVAGEVVGLCGIKAAPSLEGEVEIGYGVAASRRRRGYATAAVAALVATLARDERVLRVLALTVPGNVASQRALAANGFTRTGTQVDAGDGEVIRWELPVRETAGVERA